MSDPSEPTFEEQLEAEFSEDARRVREIIEDSEETTEQEPEQEPGQETEPDPVASDEGEEGGEEGGEKEGDVSEPPSDPDDGFVEIAGQKIRKDEAQALVEFYEWARHNPQAMAGINGYLSGQYVLTPAEQAEQARQEKTTEVDDEWEDVDPAVKQRFEELKRQTEELDQWRQEWMQQQTQEQVARAQTDLQTGREKFNSKYELTGDELQTLEAEAAELAILPALISKHQGDRVAAVEEALETAYWRSEEFRQREIDKRQISEKNDQKRKQKASKLTGSSGSVPRNRPEPSTAEQRREAMITEIADAMQN